MSPPIQAARDRVQGVLQQAFPKNGDKGGLVDGVESIIRTMFAPCAGVTDIGGVPRDEIGGFGPISPNMPQPQTGGAAAARAWPANVPFEVTAKTRSDLSKEEAELARRQAEHSVDPSRPYPHAASESGPISPTDPRQLQSRAKLRQLGARHQLASGLYGDSLAQTARPVSPERPKPAGQDETPDLVDFDDGISALSSHTLEEMERFRQMKEMWQQAEGLPDHVINQQASLNDAFGKPFVLKPTSSRTTHQQKNSSLEWMEMLVADNSDRGAVVRKVSDPPESVNKPAEVDLARGQSSNTRTTALTEDTNGTFERAWKADEAKYWEDVAKEDVKTRRTPTRPPNESRTGTTRELSRSRSRSDGTGSAKKITKDAIHHPHDTVPMYASDLVASKSRKSRKSKKSSQSSFVPGSFAADSAGDVVSPNGAAPSSLVFGEI